MRDDHDELEHLLKQWRIEGAPVGLARRIAGEATRRPQRQPWSNRLRRSMERSLTEWRYGLALKAGTLAMCVLAGLAVGHLRSPAPERQPDVVAIAFAQDVWTDRL